MRTGYVLRSLRLCTWSISSGSLLLKSGLAASVTIPTSKLRNSAVTAGLILILTRRVPPVAADPMLRYATHECDADFSGGRIRPSDGRHGEGEGKGKGKLGRPAARRRRL